MADTLRYKFKDHLGSIRTTVDESGAVVGYDDYYPYGLTMPGRSSNTGNPNADYKFTGYEVEDDLGLNLYNAGARLYDPVIGRFMQMDPLAREFPNISPYIYGNSNPLRYTDPTGMAPEKCPRCWEFFTNTIENIKESWDNFKKGINEYLLDKNTQLAEQTGYLKDDNEVNLVKNVGYATASAIDNTHVLPYVSVSVSKADSYGPDFFPFYGTATKTIYGTYLSAGADGTGGFGIAPISVSAGLILKHGGPVLPSDLSGQSGGVTAGVGIGFEAASSIPFKTIQVGVALSPNIWIGANAGYTFGRPLQDY